jgi:hypothetical protein
LSLRQRRPDTHGAFRALISQRLDERLTAEDARRLRSHLLTCARCRAADRDFRAQRALLRAPAPGIPPRDLWARTSAALDREVARGGRSGLTPEPRAIGRPARGAAAIGSLLVMATAVAVIGSQLGSRDATRPPSANVAAAPTPFEVPTQELAIVGQDEAGLAIYRTDVSVVCPERAIDCTTVVSGNRQVVRLRDKDHLRPNSVAFHPQRDKVAIAATSGRGEAVYVVLLKPVPRSLDATESDAPRPVATAPTATFASADATASVTATFPTPAGGAAIATTPPSAPASTPPSAAPSGSVAVASPSAGPSATSGASQRPTATPNATPTSGRPSPTATTRPSDPVSPSPAATSSATNVPAAPTTPIAGTPGPTASTAPALGTAPATSAADLAEIVPILQDVLPAGAEPAWSPDGEVLAFSAMPADGSHGPDIYVWRTGAQHAERLTDDHRSYFASWAGDRIVASRGVRPADANRNEADPGSRVATVVIDLETGEQRTVSAKGLWLPIVDPTQRFAVVWRGELRHEGAALEPHAGGLYLQDWQRLDPFRAGAATASPTAGPSAQPSAAADAGAEPVELGRDTARDPVLDWLVRWNADGDAYGFWVADGPGAGWGRLAIAEVDRSTGRINRETDLLGPTLARRSFTIGQDRVAWVAPVEEKPEGELRVRTWGPNGNGTVRIRDIDAGKGVPGF